MYLIQFFCVILQAYHTYICLRLCFITFADLKIKEVWIYTKLNWNPRIKIRAYRLTINTIINCSYQFIMYCYTQNTRNRRSLLIIKNSYVNTFYIYLINKKLKPIMHLFLIPGSPKIICLLTLERLKWDLIFKLKKLAYWFLE